jgi:uncharacterized protein YrrD
MTLLMRATDLIGMPVVTIDGGEDVAEVKDVVFDPDRNEVMAFTLNKRGRFHGSLKQILPWPAVHAIGRDAVMIESAGSLADRDDLSGDLREPPANRDVIGDAVVTDAGVALARVADIVVEVGDEQAAVVGYALDNGKFVPIPQQLAVSGETLVVPATVERFLVDDLAGFAAAVESFRADLAGGEQ